VDTAAKPAASEKADAPAQRTGEKDDETGDKPVAAKTNS
jgi:hypothetical protein